MKNLADFRVCREKGGDAGRGRRTLRVPFVRHREAWQNRGRATPVEDAAAHRHQVHDGVGELRVARRDVTPEVTIGAA